jgi:hypothetical protein
MQGNKSNVTTEIWQAIAAIGHLAALVIGRVPEVMIGPETEIVRGQGLVLAIEARTLEMAAAATQARIGVVGIA